MAASCMGAFGAYKLGWSRHGRFPKQHGGDGEHQTVWVTKRYIPTDLRVNAPVPRHKPIVPHPREIPIPEKHWIPLNEAAMRAFTRDHEEKLIFVSQPSTRCEEWSTLRQMLPSRGRPVSDSPPNWGSGFGDPPGMTYAIQTRFPHINSPMTRYTDQMHLTNSLFRLH